MLSHLKWHTAILSQFYGNFRKPKRFKMTSVKLPPIYFFIYCKFNLFTSRHAFKAPFFSIIFHLKRSRNGPSNCPSLTSDPMPFPGIGAIFHRDVGLKAHSMSREKINWTERWTEEWNFFPALEHCSKSETLNWILKTDTRLCLSADIIKMGTKTRLQRINGIQNVLTEIMTENLSNHRAMYRWTRTWYFKCERCSQRAQEYFSKWTFKPFDKTRNCEMFELRHQCFALCYRRSVSRSLKAREELFEFEMQIAR